MTEYKTKIAIFASGCFWGTQYYLGKADGVIDTFVGYTGGNVENPIYEQVSSGLTGHVEAVKVEYDPTKTTFEKLAKLFFETHDFTQVGGQGPDIGSQYQSKIFYSDDAEKKIAENLVEYLTKKGFMVATIIESATKFYPAEECHQDYYQKTGGTPYCHVYRKIFD